MSMWRPFAPDAVRIIKKATAIAEGAGARRLRVEHLYSALIEELGTERVASVPAPVHAHTHRPPAEGAMKARTPTFDRDARHVLEIALTVADRRLITGDDLVHAMASLAERRAHG